MSTARKLAVTDWSILAALALAIAQAVALTLAVRSGLGRRVAFLEASQGERTGKAIYATGILMILAFTAAKVSIIALVTSIHPTKPVRIGCYTLFGVVGLWCVSSAFVQAFQCNLPRPWTMSDGEGTMCVQQLALQKYICVLNILTDVAVVGLATWMMYGVQTALRRKATVSALFGLRLATIPFAVLALIGDRTYYAHPEDRSWYAVTPAIWGQVLLNVSIITACIPSTKRFFTDVQSGLMGVTISETYEMTHSGGNATPMMGSDSAGRSKLGSVIAGRFGLASRREAAKIKTSGTGNSQLNEKRDSYANLGGVAYPNIAKVRGGHVKDLTPESGSVKGLTSDVIRQDIEFEVVSEDRDNITALPYISATPPVHRWEGWAGQFMDALVPAGRRLTRDTAKYSASAMVTHRRLAGLIRWDSAIIVKESGRGQFETPGISGITGRPAVAEAVYKRPSTENPNHLSQSEVLDRGRGIVHRSIDQTVSTYPDLSMNSTRLGGQAFNHGPSSNSEQEYDRLRDLARKEQGQHQHFAAEARQAYDHGDGSKAHDMSEKSKEHAAAADRYNKQASEFIFRENNAVGKVASDTIDLHGQFVEEAEEIVEQRIRYAQSTGQQHLHVIVGKGNHSPGHVQKIKPRVEQVCQELGLQYNTEHNEGRMYIDLRPGQHAPPQMPAYNYQQHHEPQHQQYGQPHYQSAYPMGNAPQYSYANAAAGGFPGGQQQQQQQYGGAQQQMGYQQQQMGYQEPQQQGKKPSLSNCCGICVVM
nr:hypothetical protein B0A51_00485 [Rachicladosporium sp. CCFEE 5018]